MPDDEEVEESEAIGEVHESEDEDDEFMLTLDEDQEDDEQ